jgi:glutamyl-tRNA synthetase
MPKVVTRFAPSPTGFLHIGGARTALYNWLFARHHGGRFLLRIEDTDRKRSTDEAIDAILAGMKWLGLDWDGDAVSQAARADRHKEAALDLLEQGRAYKCYANPEELAEARDTARAQGENFLGDLWRDRDASGMPADAPYSVRLKMPREGETTITDAVQGPVTVQNGTLDDMVLLRSDGTPTYMLAVVVDDHDMGVTHIVRGDDHLNNAFRQHQLYVALGWDAPMLAHIPLIHGADGKKLSKRHGALGVEAYRDMGYLPAAMRNYLLRLGWSHGDDEIISTEQAIEWFNLENIGRGAARFDFDKLDNLNGHYIRHSEPGELLSAIENDLEKEVGHTLDEVEKSRIKTALPSLAERAKRLPDLVESASLFCNSRPLSLTDKAANLMTEEALVMFDGVAKELEAITQWNAGEIKAAIMSFAEAKDLKLGKVMQPIRAAVTGGKQSGDLIETLEILGQEETIGRLRDRIAA